MLFPTFQPNCRGWGGTITQHRELSSNAPAGRKRSSSLSVCSQGRGVQEGDLHLLYRLNSICTACVPPKNAQAVRSFASYPNGIWTLYHLYRLKSKTFIYRKTRVTCNFLYAIYRKVVVQVVQHIVLLDIPTFKVYHSSAKVVVHERYKRYTSGTNVTTHAA